MVQYNFLYFTFGPLGILQLFSIFFFLLTEEMIEKQK